MKLQCRCCRQLLGKQDSYVAILVYGRDAQVCENCYWTIYQGDYYEPREDQGTVGALGKQIFSQ